MDLKQTGLPKFSEREIENNADELTDIFYSEEFNGKKDKYKSLSLEFLKREDDFFTAPNLKKLAKFKPFERIAFIAYFCLSLDVNAKHAAIYLEYFPDDIKIIDRLMVGDRSIIFNLKVVFADFLTLSNEQNLKENIQVASDRKKIYSERVLSEEKRFSEIFKEDSSLKKFDVFKEFYKAFNGDDSDKYIGKDFLENLREKLPEEQVNIIISIITEAQFVLVFDQTLNASNQTRQSVINRRSMYAHNVLFREPLSLNDYRETGQEYFPDAIELLPFKAEYPCNFIIDACLNFLAKMEGLENNDRLTRFIVSFWDKNRNPIFTNSVVEVLNKNPEFASKLLLEKISKEKIAQDKNALLAILYRVELGRIGISKEGLKLFEQMYDLGEYNNEDNFAERISNNGEIGIFSEDNQLQGVVGIDPLQSNNKTLVVKLSIEMFFDKLNMDKMNKSDMNEWLESFKDDYHKIFVEYFRERLGVNTQGFSLQQQMSIYMILKNNSKETLNQMHSFVAKYKELGLQIISNLINLKDLEFIGYLGEAALVKLCEIQIFLTELKVSNPKYAEKLDRQLNTILQTKYPSIKDKEKALEAFDHEIILSISLSRENEYKDFEIEVKSGGVDGTLLDKDKDFMRGLYRQHYSGQELEVLLQGLENNFNNPDSSFYLLKTGSKLVGYLVINDKRVKNSTGGNIYYASGFNMADIARGESVGNKFLEVVMKYFGKRGVVQADCDALVMGRHYINFGFIGTSAKLENGKIILDIEYSDTNLRRYKVQMNNSKKVDYPNRNDIDFKDLQEPYVLTGWEENNGKISLVYEEKKLSNSDASRKLREE